ncbi:type III secretion system effector E3 ubiquitin transferase SspH1 [Salmonella enterica]|uniref:type III secretion system effector E3 ubiquitin transferase SspH1 n=1 Tax=Salmonella enterica TaxID=28901 RepID=UPI00127744D4|nr:type III secretion system effector E3 ubiquitin transferase SspH1 [Salmonella enterica]ECE6011979.1 type III secretion system effector E3 ubiquitin transferase SspH1 [Salmonella enterica subsp. salamae]EDU6438739.1 type III secretion system effector E3 ubiquitin transferase SspH1 [Salmonella enterica subsp. salamae serovar 47:b:e,n,x,z15]EAP4935215.1 type III secretion system effector E3 ubiquitin transferase SspH1 [Salmonella enterica]EAW0072092.1 type III secretion system effector E3 ubiqu
MFNIRNTQPSVSMQAIAGAAAPEASPEEIVWEKIQFFFPQENYEEAQQCLAELCHPARGMLPDHISSQFERLKALTFPAWEENIQCNRDGINQFCILNADSKEILSITLDDAGNYTVNCQGYSEAHDFIMDTEQGEECTEFAEGASGTSLRPATTASQTAAEYDAVWSKWERDAPAGESPGRAAVVQEMRDCLNNGNPVINVGASGLTTLPDRLPPHITTLVIPDNNLTSLPELPEGLRELEVSGNLQLTSLPSLPQGLQKLWTYNNWLASLPTLPPALRELRVSGNNLTSLPALPSGLQTLWAYNNRLTSLPEMSPGLQELDVSHNQLTRLPQSLTGLSSAARVYLDGNPLSVRTLQALRDIIGHSGIRIHFDMAGPSVPREARALHLAVADWLTSAREGEAAQADRWQAFGLEDNAAAFSLVLDRLRETENFKKDAGFKAQISSWLTQLAEDAALRAKTFAMATEATSTCEDRVTHALHQMNNVQLVHNAEKGEYDNNLQGLVSTGREMFRLATLEQIAREKAGTLALVDDVEVYLAFQNKLKESLELTSVTSEMRFFDVSGVTVSDLQAAELQVKTAENSGFSKWILQWGPLHSVLERKVPERFNALREKQISDYEDTYRKLYDEVLKSSGLVDDTDAERTIGVSAMDSAKKKFLDGLRALVDEVLGSYLTARWRLN